MVPLFFPTPASFRRWLEQNHKLERELWVGFYKISTRKPSITWPEAVDQLLCFGWIDGVRMSLGEESYVIRVTPRNARSIWSAVNEKRAQELRKLGLMRPAGLAAFNARDKEKTNRYSFERDRVKLKPSLQKQLRKNSKAWTFFTSQPPGYRKTILWWIMSAKQDATRERRLAVLIQDSEAGRRVNFFQPGKAR
jgi:uncharacterized protein YdeI (YjbR/CyaY-like superfamily)